VTWFLRGKSNQQGFCYAFTVEVDAEATSCVEWAGIPRDQVVVRRELPVGEAFAALAITDGTVTLNGRELTPVVLGPEFPGVPPDAHVFIGVFGPRPTSVDSTATSIPAAGEHFEIVPAD